jgi:BNR repeat-like domain/BNR/Asp-box repeat
MPTGTWKSALVAVILATPACDRSATVRFSDAQPLSRTTVVGTAPMFTVSPAGAEAAAWVSDPTGGTDASLYVSVDGGPPISLGDSLGPVEAHGESPPKIAFGPDGSLNALYVVPKVVPGRRFPLAALRFVRSRDGGKTWTKPVTVTDDSEFGAHNFHALHVAADGTIYISWLGGDEGKSATWITRSTDGGASWAPRVRVSPREACPCCRTALATGSDGTLYLGWRDVAPGNVRDVVVARSSDRGASWSPPVRVHADNWVFDGCPHAGPSVRVDGAGRVHVAWWTGRPDSAGVYYARSEDGAKTFGPTVPLGVARFSRPAHVQLALGGADTVIATWDDGTKKTPQVVLRVSTDGGRHFAPSQPLSAAGDAAGFPVIALSPKGVAVAWSQEPAPAADGEDGQGHAAHETKEQKTPVGLHAVGDAHVMVRRGVFR